MNYVDLDIREWTMFNARILELAENELPAETKKFMRRMGTKAATATRRLAKATFKKKTGHYFNSIRGSKSWRNQKGGYGVYAYATRKDNLGNHAHLLEYGHDQQVGKYVPAIHAKLMVSRVEGKRVFERAAKNFAPVFLDEANKFVDNLLESNFTTGRSGR